MEYDGLKELEELNYELSKASWGEYHKAMDECLNKLGEASRRLDKAKEGIKDIREYFGIQKEEQNG